MKLKILVATIFLFLAVTAKTQQFNTLGHPLITNFSVEDYNGTEQTWSIIQDNRGVMYFGTWENGIVEYDGVCWRKIPIPNNKPIYSLAKDSAGTIYVGASGDFGFLQPTTTGNLEYISLTNKLCDSLKQGFTHIFKTYHFKSKTYFCSTDYIFIYNGNTVEATSLGRRSEYASFLTFICKDVIYIGSYRKGLLILNNKNLKPAPGANAFIEKNIFAILPLSDQENLMVTDQGLYKYNTTSGVSAPIRDNYGFIGTMVQNAIPYSPAQLYNNNYGIGSIQSDWLSYVLFSQNLTPLEIVNKQIGLTSSQITHQYQEGDSPIWLAFYDGAISRFEANSNLRKFASESGIDDLITDIIRFNGTIYISTFNGVYYLKFQETGIPKFYPVENINGTVWDMLEFKTSNGKSILLAGSYTDGVFEIRNGKAYSISEKLRLKFPKIQHNVFTLYQSTVNPEVLYLGMAGSLASVTWKGDWVETKRIKEEEINYPVRTIHEDRYGNIWLGSQTKGLNIITSQGQYIDYSSHKNLADSKEFSFISSNDSLFIVSSTGIMHYNYHDSTFVKGGLIDTLSNINGFYKILKDGNGFAAICTNKQGEYWIQTVEKDSAGTWRANTTPFKRLPNKSIDALFVDNDGTIWIGMSKELYSYNPTIKRNFDQPFRTLIRKVVAKDSLLFEGCYYSVTNDGRHVISTEQQPIQIPRLSYHYNGVVISFASPYFERETDMQFCHYLEGSDEKTWSKWDYKTEATYTNLREGKYVFRVKAKNIYGTESIVAKYAFEIKAPWYRTIIAYILYFILFVVLVWGIVKWNMRRLIAEKEHLEQVVKERTAEVVAQKEEIEVQNEKIATQNEEIKSSIQYASRIQNAILTPKNQIGKIFPENFILFLPRDIVSGDFYYITQIGNKKICVIADCTGHGVPGGFMSMLGVSFLTQIISETSDIHASTILNKLRQQVITALHQTSEIGGSKDGMDLALYIFDEQTMTVEFAGANNPLILISNGELNHIKGDKMPIGIHMRSDMSFTDVEIPVKKGDVLYTFSDGYADQFGGDDARKFMIKNLKELLLQIHQKPMDEQRAILEATLIRWHGNSPRIDDVVVMGVRV